MIASGFSIDHSSFLTSTLGFSFYFWAFYIASIIVIFSSSLFLLISFMNFSFALNTYSLCVETISSYSAEIKQKFTKVWSVCFFLINIKNVFSLWILSRFLGVDSNHFVSL